MICGHCPLPMILTEEQRAALKRVVAYMDDMYAIASPYHGCTEDANLLRAMIDSSDHIVEPDELIGFDLERARGLRDFLQDDCAEVGDVWGEMIAEIERLRADYDKLKSSLLVIDGCKKLMNQAARIDELEADNQNLVTLNKSLMNNDWILRDNNRKYRKRAQKAELLNKELKADLEQSERVIEARLDVIDQQAARIKELKANCIYDPETGKVFVPDGHPELEKLRARNRDLEDALVEGLTNFLHYRASCYDPARRCPYAKECDDCSTWDACGHVEMFRSEARRQLQAEGKIGPDARPKCDHAWQAAIEERGYQTCLKCGECRNIEDIPRTATAPAWQITEERVGLLEYCLETLLDAPDIEEIPGPGHSIEVLRAMLTEAGQ